MDCGSWSLVVMHVKIKPHHHFCQFMKHTATTQSKQLKRLPINLESSNTQLNHQTWSHGQDSFESTHTATFSTDLNFDTVSFHHSNQHQCTSSKCFTNHLKIGDCKCGCFNQLLPSGNDNHSVNHSQTNKYKNQIKVFTNHNST